MKFREFIKNNTVTESKIKFEVLSMVKELHTKIATLSLVDVMGVMSPDNPAKKEIQALETEINNLTNDIGDFIQKYIPDVADEEPDVADEEPDEEPEDPNKPKKKEEK